MTAGRQRPSRPDPLARAGRDPDTPWWVWLLALLLSLGTICVVAAIFVINRSLAPPSAEPEPSLVFVEIEPPPESVVAPDETADDAPDEGTEDPAEPEPEPEPEPETPAPEPEPEPEPEPVQRRDPTPVRAERPTRTSTPSQDLPPEEPRALEPDERPVQIGLEGQSFADGDGPVFAQGDTARGGRPARRSVDPADTRQAAPGAAEGGIGTGDGAGSGDGGRPTTRPRGQGSRRASLAPGVSRRVPYPSAAFDRGIEATCRARISVGADGSIGTVADVSCDESGFGFEDALRRHIIDNFRFRPETVDGQPVATEIRWTHDFRIDN